MMGTSKVDEVLEEGTKDTGRHEYKVKWVGYTNHHNIWVVEEDLHTNHPSKSSATTDGVQSTEDSTQAGRGR